MKIEKVSYQKTYSIGPYLTDRIGLEASIDDKESVADVLDNLRAKADEWHKLEHPHLYQEQETYPKIHDGRYRFTHVTSGQLPEIKVSFEDGSNTLELIQNAPDMPALTSFKLLASKDTILYHAYCQRIKELTAQK